jgi:Ser/Thr protein kinase RdoA (MazF antagonist)
VLDVGDARRLADRFALGDRAQLSGPVATGEQGAVWRLDTDVATFAVKDVFEPPGELVARASASFQDAADAAGVLTPTVVRTPDGDVLARVHDTQVRVYRWVDLRGPDLELDPVEVGMIVAGIHRLRFPAEGEPEDWYSAPVGAQRWDEVVEALCERAAPFAAELRSLRTELLALEQWIAPGKNLQVCHRDLWADNVQATRDGIICVFDWENSGPADPSQELACVLFEFAGTDMDRALTLYQAYRSCGGPGRMEGPAAFSMLVAQLGHILERHCRLWLQNTSATDRAHRESAIAEVSERPHTRKTLQALLDAVISG